MTTRSWWRFQLGASGRVLGAEPPRSSEVAFGLTHRTRTMPPELTPALLASPAAEGVRVIATKLLGDVGAGYDAFVAEETTGLHDLRVAMRRLRSWLRAHRELVNDTLRKRTRRRLRDLADATNNARDAEVAVEWIAEQSQDLLAREKPGTRYIAQKLEQEREVAFRETRAALDGALPKLLASISAELETYWVRQPINNPAPPVLMSSVTRDVLVAHGEQLVRTLGRIESHSDFRGIHRARIAAKRLRYLLQETSDDETARVLIAKLTALQDALGHSHDMYGISNRLVREIGECAARDATLRVLHEMGMGDDVAAAVPAFTRIRPGLAMLARRAHESDQKAYDLVRNAWRKRAARKVSNEIKAYAQSIGQPSAPLRASGSMTNSAIAPHPGLP